MLTEQLYQLYLQHPVISTDTRKITENSMFFALKGDKFDANTFAQQALEAGAAYAVIDNEAYRINDRCILVEDVLTALQDLARHHRRQLQIPVIGLTGTNGKTTTKELINAVLSQQFKTLATIGNLNNHIGVPLTILSIRPTHEVAIIEMGANHQKEIELLCTIAQPSHGLITNVGKAHLEGFGGVEGVKKGKGELYDYLKATGGMAFIHSDSQALLEMQDQRELKNVTYYGTDAVMNAISGQLTGNAPYLSLTWRRKSEEQQYHVASQLTGEYNLPNILAAICIGDYLKLSTEQINQGIAGYQPKNNRSQILQTATNTLICDYYNANPSSMAVAIENLGKMQAEHKVMILGDMFEMGDEAPAEHQAIIQKALSVPANQHIFVGEEFYQQGQNHPATFYRTAEEAIAYVQANPITNATVLLKGSRGMALERLVQYL
ncbi:UDP-N-acetylmuramoyl-tripeptide--D-alanyl-D-alanine ligase [Mucilaginibacter sp. Bleaf8]|uniref:UDP-N-acetylmuramoyl-tripeptide--D-alanyl-D- alanine ligase n=1 Tax=Mucilaginibacter sp. Bleaf8 TaxID=2834430 RepID=UPI001BCA7214|nr:UDP-N-acetylmuramoyl-tripeptide--D-alanyl-D-alanine ligase [Mucilaginibacter sp. Bleaf8]MBS7564385.1 UDP-N-acetylmuramoyl-tripeptide--D-alanyl-D-alanine ligase [Mucilaginibacter sp. Bleaf8]